MARFYSIAPDSASLVSPVSHVFPKTCLIGHKLACFKGQLGEDLLRISISLSDLFSRVLFSFLPPLVATPLPPLLLAPFRPFLPLEKCSVL